MSPGAHEKFLLHAYMESSTTHKIRKNGRRDFGYKPIFLFLCPETISEVDPARPDPTVTLFDGLFLSKYKRCYQV